MPCVYYFAIVVGTGSESAAGGPLSIVLCHAGSDVMAR